MYGKKLFFDMTYPLKSDHNNLNHPEVGVRILLKSNLEYTELIQDPNSKNCRRFVKLRQTLKAPKGSLITLVSSIALALTVL